jgi:hypothetical protein
MSGGKRDQAGKRDDGEEDQPSDREAEQVQGILPIAAGVQTHRAGDQERQSGGAGEQGQKPKSARADVEGLFEKSDPAGKEEGQSNDVDERAEGLQERPGYDTESGHMTAGQLIAYAYIIARISGREKAESFERMRLILV